MRKSRAKPKAVPVEATPKNYTTSHISPHLIHLAIVEAYRHKIESAELARLRQEAADDTQFIYDNISEDMDQPTYAAQYIVEEESYHEMLHA